MGTTTPNHGYDKPEVNADDDVWGDLINSTIDALDDDVVIKDTFANRPAAGTANRWFLATDRLELYHDTGSAWDRVLESAARVDESETISAVWTFNTQPSGINHSALDGIGASDHHAKYTDEEAQDAVNALLVGGTGISLTYDDAGNSLTIDGHTRYSDEEAQDAVGTILGTHLTYDDATPSITIGDDTVTVAGNTVTLGGSTTVAHADLSNIGASDHHTRYSDEEAQDAVGGILAEGLNYDDGANSINAEEPVSYDPGHTEWEAGLSNEEVWRIVLQSGETLVIDRIEFRQKGGGSSTSVDIDVRDTTAATTIGSQTLGGTTKNPGSSGSGNTVIVRVTNGLTTAVNAAPRIVGRIQGA